jgi:hypothetical protein
MWQQQQLNSFNSHAILGCFLITPLAAICYDASAVTFFRSRTPDLRLSLPFSFFPPLVARCH